MLSDAGSIPAGSTNKNACLYGGHFYWRSAAAPHRSQIIGRGLPSPPGPAPCGPGDEGDADCRVGLCPPRNDRGRRHGADAGLCGRRPKSPSLRRPQRGLWQSVLLRFGDADCRVGLCPPRNDRGRRRGAAGALFFAKKRCAQGRFAATIEVKISMCYRELTA